MNERHIPEHELIQTRLEKLNRLREIGRDPFAIERFERRCAIKRDEASFEVEPYSTDIIAAFEESEASETQKTTQAPEIDVRIAGRIVSLRLMGKAAFAHIQDRKGRIQIYFKQDDLGDDYEIVKLLDLGDFIGINGFVFRTRTGEITVHARELIVLAKSLRPIPFGKEKGEQHWYGLQDVEQRYRQRHVDLITNHEARETFEKRSRIIRAIREFYDNRGYLEVETPVLQLVAGGAAARPFLTYHNALDHEFKLRISLELYLKRLVVGGLERVYEIGRVFRNEGIDARHSPEYTLLESYEAYAQLEDVMDLVEELFRHICRSLYGGTTFEYQGAAIELAGPWKRLPILEGIQQYAGVTPDVFDSLETALAAMKNLGLPTDQENMVGGIIEKIHERFVQPNLVQPTFITDFPIETSPLAKKRQDNPRLVRRFEAYVAKQEVANAFSEINDPLDQRERFEHQMKMRAAGDEEAHPMDEDFLRALEYGMPPTGGLGIGIDRLVMVLCNETNLRDVILFPTMKPER
ncbi:MAG: lysine--tRNA ligase [Armatimonadetes bacterium]|nr:lysine--tRNA ligase [Armatimonadota bacterium]